MIYLLDDNKNEFAIGVSDISHLLDDNKFVAVDENGVFEYNYMNLKRQYVSFIDIHTDIITQRFRIIGFDYKGKYHEVTAPKQITTSNSLYIYR